MALLMRCMSSTHSQAALGMADTGLWVIEGAFGQLLEKARGDSQYANQAMH